MSASPLIVAFHGYGQDADDALAEVRKIPGASRWRIVSVQALHRFYTRDQSKIVGSWLTRQDRELGIADNVEYVDRVIDELFGPADPDDTPNRLVFVGFSQGASMAYRAAMLGRHRACGIIALAGDIPPELGVVEQKWPPVLLGAGRVDEWYAEGKLNADISFLESRGVSYDLCRFAGGHEWTDEFRDAAGRWLAARAHGP